MQENTHLYKLTNYILYCKIFITDAFMCKYNFNDAIGLGVNINN